MTEEPGGLQFMGGHKESDVTEWLTNNNINQVQPPSPHISIPEAAS